MKIIKSVLFFTILPLNAIFATLDQSSSGIFIDQDFAVISNSQQLTFVGPRAGEGYFSKDGKKMIYQSEREPGNPFFQMYILDLISGKSQRISTGVGKTTCGWISPDMTKAVWSSTHLDSKIASKVTEEYESRKKTVKSRYSWSYDENYDVFISDLGGKSVHRLTNEKGYDAEGSISPDGKTIVFASNRLGYKEKLSEEDQRMFTQDPSYMMELYKMNIDGSHVQQLTNVRGYDGGPFFSTDGSKITWRRFAPNGASAEIYVMNSDGSDQHPVTQLKSMSWAPYFHPSGDYLIFTSSLLGYANFELFIVDTQGKQKPARVTFTEGFDGLPVFDPSGSKLSWTKRNEKGESQIYLSDWDDAKARKALHLPPASLQMSALNPAITAKDIEKTIRFLASEQLAGRATGSSGEAAYVESIVALLKSWGLEGGYKNKEYIQEFEFTSGVELGPDNQLEFVGAHALKLQPVEQFIPLSFSNSGEVSPAPVVFAGYGLRAPATEKNPSYDSYKALDVKGKWVVILKDIPDNVSPEMRYHLSMYGKSQHKVTVAKNLGAVGVVIVSESLKSGKTPRFEGGNSAGSIAVLEAKEEFIKSIFQKNVPDLSALKQELNKGIEVAGFIFPSLYLRAKVDLIIKKQIGHNIIAKLPSGQKDAGALLVGAHGDHLGRGEMGSSLAKGTEVGQIHFGADDNASGVAGVLELAHFFVDQKKHQKPLMKDLWFGIWSGEEIGVLGSSHFTKSFPEISKKPFHEYFQAAINMDMIGRLRDKLYIQGVGSGNYWNQLSEEVVLKNAMAVNLQEDPYLPTDSMTFYLAQVPSISLFTGSHAEYHSPRDIPDLINFEGVKKVTSIARDLLSTLGDSKQSLVKYVKVEGSAQNQLSGRSFRVYVGSIPDYTQEGIKGVRISGASKGSPAEKGGLQEKDVIIEFAGLKIENIYDYVYALQAAKPAEEVLVKVQRSGKIVELKITPQLKD